MAVVILSSFGLKFPIILTLRPTCSAREIHFKFPPKRYDILERRSNQNAKRKTQNDSDAAWERTKHDAAGNCELKRRGGGAVQTSDAAGKRSSG